MCLIEVTRVIVMMRFHWLAATGAGNNNDKYMNTVVSLETILKIRSIKFYDDIYY